MDEESLGPRSELPLRVAAWMITRRRQRHEQSEDALSVFEKCFLSQRRRSLEDLKVLPGIEYVNPCVALVRAAQGAQGLIQAQRPKHCQVAVHVWIGIEESALKGLGLRVADGVDWIDTLGYDDTLQRSVVQAYGQRSDQVPKPMLIAPIWANMGVYGLEDTEWTMCR